MKNPSLRAACLALSVALTAAGLAAQTTQPFRKYVANGDSITAGVQGNCLVERHQQKTFARIIAAQLGIMDFQSPLVGETRAITNPAFVCLGAVVLNNAITVGAVSQQTNPRNATLARPYDNLGLPGARASHLVDLRTANPTGDTANQSAALVLRNFPGGPFVNRSALELTNMLTPDLVTLWIGNNDVLGAALSGVAQEGVTLTPVTAFRMKFGEVITGLRATGRILVVLNVPDVAAVPFTTTVAPFILGPGGQQIRLLGPRTTPSCSTAPCPLPDGTLVTLQAASLLRMGVGIPTQAGGTGQPLPDGSFTPPTGPLTAGVLLYPDEVTAIRARVNELNAEIQMAASANGAVLVNVNAIFEEIKARGLEIGGITLNPSLLTGGLFSADGFHPSNIAHAILADEIIQVLNRLLQGLNPRVQAPQIERPNIASALFTPDEPSATPTSIDPAVLWRSILASVPPVEEGIEVVLPSFDPPTRAPRLGPGKPERGSPRG